jgi:hypothetical protein
MRFPTKAHRFLPIVAPPVSAWAKLPNVAGAANSAGCSTTGAAGAAAVGVHVQLT